ncbi:hypothetical protein DYB37_002212 [Aphanomyces astaci]|uniref:Uncharacterized protein n=1 Tax=Aphanomyces astaci TaxID=112090 RepID=A0A3R7BBB5_APHAT|nr:hypothetical protein DYB35_001949 [Aphanomyces astaci]RHZ23939.1 hypothetical protein DYB37_002212 [Aphanomyces astaci]
MSSDTGATAPTLSEKTLARRRYYRDKQREYRRKLNAEGVAMEAELVHLRSIRDSLRAMGEPPVREASDGPLSWCTIAKVFKREAHRVLTDRQALVTQTQEYQTLMQAMQCFVVMNIPLPMSRSNAWYCATLAAEPRARTLGKEWLTQQLYHNMHKPFASFPAVNYDDEFCHIDVQTWDDDDPPFMYMERLQYSLPGTLHMFRRLIESNMQAVMTEVRQVSPSHILVRVVSHLSRLHQPATGFVSVDAFAAMTGIDVMDVNNKDAYVRREMIRRGHAEFLPWRQRFMDMMHHQTTIN